MAEALIAAAVSLFGTIMTISANRKNQEDSEKFTKEENELAYQRSKPVQQVKDLKEAGLNPNLVYSTITPASYNATPGQRTDIPDVGQSLLSGFNAGFNKRNMLKSAELDLERKELENEWVRRSMPGRLTSIDKKNALMAGQLANTLLDSKLKDAKTKLTSKQYEHLEATIRKIEGDIALQSKLGQLRDLEVAEKTLTNELNKELKPMGMTVNDPLWARLILMHILQPLLDKINNSTPRTKSELERVAEQYKRSISERTKWNVSPHYHR